MPKRKLAEQSAATHAIFALAGLTARDWLTDEHGTKAGKAQQEQPQEKCARMKLRELLQKRKEPPPEFEVETLGEAPPRSTDAQHREPKGTQFCD